MKILNGQEAFGELSAGKKIEARHQQATEFDSLDNFPATILVNPEYEFRIALTFITIGEMQVPEPIKEVPAKGIQCFAPSMLTEELSKSFKWKNSDLDLALLQRGQVHLDQEHAVKHSLALIAVSCGSVETCTDTDVNQDVDSAQVDASDSDTSSEVTEETESAVQKFLGAIDKCTSDYELQGVELNLNGHKDKFHLNTVEILKQRISKKRESLNEVKKPVTAETLKGFSAQNDTCTAYVQKIKISTTPDELYALSQTIIADDKLNIDQQERLCQLVNDRAEELNINAPESESVVDEQAKLIDEIDQQATKAVQDKIHKDAMAGNASNYPIDMLYNQKKKMLINRIQEMDSIEALERLAPAIPAAKLNPEDHQELLQIYAERKTAMEHADRNSEAS